MSLTKIVFKNHALCTCCCKNIGAEYTCYTFTLLESKDLMSASVQEQKPIWFEATGFMRLFQCDARIGKIKYDVVHKYWPKKWIRFWGELCVHLNVQCTESLFKRRLKCHTIGSNATTIHQIKPNDEFLKWYDHTIFLSLECIQYLLLSPLTSNFFNKFTFTTWLGKFISHVKCRHSSFHIEYVDLMNDVLWSNGPCVPYRIPAVNNSNNSQFEQLHFGNINYHILVKQFETILKSNDEYKVLVDVPLYTHTLDLEDAPKSNVSVDFIKPTSTL